MAHLTEPDPLSSPSSSCPVLLDANEHSYRRSDSEKQCQLNGHHIVPVQSADGLPHNTHDGRLRRHHRDRPPDQKTALRSQIQPPPLCPGRK
ncbi:uncharacterized protein METZ01_LOCUS157373 [marine metagenome]|uniref:Uncharacterized protein n=1 Tax=marine metagenome TaxID=408172 RepID=A0A382ASV8_9ZZZZ